MITSLLIAASAQALAPGIPAYDPRTHKAELAGKPAEVLVLGSPHLSQLPEKLDPKLLDPLLDRLVKFRPDVIAIEGISGEQCELLKQFRWQHADAWDTYCWDTADWEKSTGLTVAQASKEIEQTLAAWPSEPTPAQRRHLAMLFMAANDRPSAQVQWRQLPEAERHAGDGFTEAMIAIVERKNQAPNESYDVAAALAARLGLQRIYLMDDHTADWPLDEKSPEGEAYGKALQALWDVKPVPAVRAEYLKLQGHLTTSADVLGFYRFLNAPKTQRETIAADMGAAARSASAQPYGRQYMSWWETRNLRMTSNIHAAFQQKPGAHVLVVVGATHKGHLDAYLNMLQDVRLVDAEQILK
jgi:hypothetical protein